MESEVAAVLLKMFALVFDVWTAVGTYYVGVSASFTLENADIYTTRLLGFSLVDDKTSANAEKYVQYLSYFLYLLECSWSNMMFLTEDNGSTNKVLPKCKYFSFRFCNPSL